MFKLENPLGLGFRCYMLSYFQSPPNVRLPKASRKDTSNFLMFFSPKPGTIGGNSTLKLEASRFLEGYGIQFVALEEGLYPKVS